jgi:hypothetical protein
MTTYGKQKLARREAYDDASTRVNIPAFSLVARVRSTFLDLKLNKNPKFF